MSFVPTAAQASLMEIVPGAKAGVLATIKRDGLPQLSIVNFVYDAEGQRILFSTTVGRAKTRNMARDPRVVMHVSTSDASAWVALEATAEISPVAADPHDATVEEHIGMFRVLFGEHPHWDEFRAWLVADRRVVARLTIGHVYGGGAAAPG